MITGGKYRINTLAKDLNLKSKELLDIFAKFGISGKTSTAVLENNDFDIIFNEITNAKKIANIDDYLNGIIIIEGAEAQIKPKAENKKEEAKSETAKEEKEVSKETIPENKTEEKEIKNTSKPAQQKPAPATKTITEPLNRQKSQQQFIRPPKQDVKNDKKDNKQFKKEQKPVYKPSQNQATNETSPIPEENRIKGKIVDTRSSYVDLSKYEEKNDYSFGNIPGITNDRQKFKKNGNKPTEGNKSAFDGKRNDKNPKEKGFKNEKAHESVVAGRDISARKNREKENAAAEKQKKQILEKARKAQLQVSIPDLITVGELASRLKATANEVVKKLMLLGVMAGINQTIDYDTAYLVADEMGAAVTKEVTVTIEEKLFNEVEDSESNLQPRAPVVVVMGHVDHGKTSLLDRIRNAHVTAGEAGGITQHIGAYRVNAKNKQITFLDTPGHEAFTAMRARGAKATDIAILVVAADDGIMPQTIEAINHAKDANLDIIVAINKMDKPTANKDNIMQELTKYELVPEEWGGDVMCVPVSAMTGMGIDDLLDDIALIAEMKEYKANPERKAKGIIIESRLDKGRGPVATVLVQNGTLHTGDVVIAGTAVGRVRAMTNEYGRTLKEAGPSVPVEIIGLDEVPAAGDEFNAVEDERMARELADQRKAKAKEDEFKSSSVVNLDDLFAAINDGVKELKIIVKADVAGSAEAVKQSLEKLSNDEVRVKVIHAAVGGITEGDVTFAAASNAIIIGFNVRPDKNALDQAERQKVDIRTHRIIYECKDEVEAAMKGMLAPTFKENILGHAEVRQTFSVPNVGTIAGSYVRDGVVKRSAQIRIVRDGIVIYEDKISSLRHIKEDKSEIAAGYECGIGLEKFNDIKIGDMLEAFEMVEVER